MKKFTIIELIIVVAMIGILISILMPCISRSKEKVKRAVCMQNLQNLYVGALSYSTDENGNFPNGTDPFLERHVWIPHGQFQVFIDKMIPYWGVKNNPKTLPLILHCPSREDWNGVYDNPVHNKGQYIYTGNFRPQSGFLMRDGLEKYNRMSKYDEPNKVTVFSDLNKRSFGKAQINHSTEYGQNFFDSGVITPHVAGGNRGSLDGSVFWKNTTDMGWDNQKKNDTLINENNRKYQAGPFYYWW